MTRIRYQDVISSNIRALAWEKGTAYVEFAGGRRFAYTLSKPDFDAMKDAKSIGGHFARFVKSKAPVVWNGWCCSNSPCKNDAVKTAEVAKTRIYLCDNCSKDTRFNGVVFTMISETGK